MRFLNILVLIVIGYFVYKYFQQRSPELKIKQLEEAADGFYDSYLSEIYQDIKKQQDKLKEKEEDKKSKKHFEKVRKEILANNRKAIKRINKFRSNVARLKERVKHESVEERLQVALDYYDFINIQDEIALDNQIWWHSKAESFGKESDEHFQKQSEGWIKVEEIEKRVKKALGKQA